MISRLVDGIEVGDNLYCAGEGWSGEVVEILDDDLTGAPSVAIVKSHDPERGAWLCVPLSSYRETDDHGGFH